MSWHRVQHTPSTIIPKVQAYTEYKHTASTSIHRVQYTPSTASTQDCLSSLHSHQSGLTPECIFSFRRASIHDWPPSASSPWEPKWKVSLSHSHSRELTNWWIESQLPACRPSIPSKYSSRTGSITASKFTRSQASSGSPNSVNLDLQVRTIMASKCISKPARSQSRSASLRSLHHVLHVYLQIHSIAASKFTQSRPPSVSLNPHDYGLQHVQSWPSSSHDHCLQVYHSTSTITASKFAWSWPPSSHDHRVQVYLQTHWITISQCISQITRLRPPSVFPNMLGYCLQVHLRIRSITTLEWIFEFTRLSFSGPPWIALEHCLQPVQIYSVQIGSHIDT